MRVKINRNILNLDSIFSYLMIFTIIYFSSSFYALSISGSISMSVILVMAILNMLIKHKGLKANYKVIFFFIITIIISIVSMILNEDGIYSYLIFWGALVSAIIVYVSIGHEEFIEKYCNIMYFLAIFSLVTYFLTIFFPSLISIFPTVTNKVGLTVNNLFFSVTHRNTAFISNSGLFWEPGAYQTFLNIAIFYQLFYCDKINFKRIIIIVITIITTFSTTAYIATSLIMITYILFIKELTPEQQKVKRKIFKAIFLIIIFGTVVFTQLPNSIKFKVFGKLEAIINPSLLNNYSYSSTAARVSSIVAPIKSMLINPFVGVGFSRLSNYSIVHGHGFLTATPLNWFGLFGLIFGMLINYPLLHWARISNRRFFSRISILVFLLMIFMTENYDKNSFYLLFILYGIDIMGYKIFFKTMKQGVNNVKCHTNQ